MTLELSAVLSNDVSQLTFSPSIEQFPDKGGASCVYGLFVSYESVGDSGPGVHRIL